MDSKSLSKDRFGKYAQEYVNSKTHARGQELDRLVEIAQPQPEWMALDIATGGGHTALKFASQVARVIATDITEKMLDAAKKFIIDSGADNVSFQLADAEKLPFEKSMFDLVTCRIAPHHFSDCPAFVQEAFRVLKPGGLFLMQDHVLPENEAAARYVDNYEKTRDPSHNRAYSHREWINMFESAGFKVEHTEEIIKTHSFQTWAKMQESSPETIETLIRQLEKADDTASDWLQPKKLRTDEATFANHHLIIAGRKQ